MADAEIMRGHHAVSSETNHVAFPYGFSLDFQCVGIINDAVADGIDQGRGVDVLMPDRHIKLRTENGRCRIVPIHN